MPTNKDMAVMVYAHPCTLMQYICKTPPHLVIVPPPLNENRKFFHINFLLLSFLIVFYCMPFFYSNMLFPVVLKVQISKNGDNLWQVLYIRSFLFKAFDKHLGSMKRYVFFKVHYLKRSLRK